MFNAVFSVTLAEGANAEQYVADAKAAAEAVSPVFLADMVLEPPMPGGNFFCEVGFADQAAYEEAKGGGVVLLAPVLQEPVPPEGEEVEQP